MVVPEWKNKISMKTYSHNLKKEIFRLITSTKNKVYKSMFYQPLTLIRFLLPHARSKGRFNATEPEPRKGSKGGHIPNSISFPISDMIVDGKLKSASKQLTDIFTDKKSLNNKRISIYPLCGIQRNSLRACSRALHAACTIAWFLKTTHSLCYASVPWNHTWAIPTAKIST